MSWIILGSIGVSLVLSLLATPVSKAMAFRFGLLDRPGHHKKHAAPTPLLGGSAVLVAVLVPALGVLALASEWAAWGVPAWMPELVKVHAPGAAARGSQALMILLGAVALHVMGIIDDRRALGPWVKLGAQLLVAVGVVVFAEVRILTALGPTGSIAVSILWLVVIINSLNFLDNMDGLATGVGAICCMALLGAALATGQLFVAGLAGLLLGALLGFLPTNYPPAKQFLGDGGSLVIGYLLGVLSCLTTYVRPGETYYTYGMFVPLVLLAVPLYDTASVMLIRLREGRNPMVGDRRHFSHRLLKRGMSVRTALLTIYLCTAATAIGATLLPRVETAGAILIFCQTLAIVSVIGLLESAGTKP